MKKKHIKLTKQNINSFLKSVSRYKKRNFKSQIVTKKRENEIFQKLLPFKSNF